MEIIILLDQEVMMDNNIQKQWNSRTKSDIPVRFFIHNDVKTEKNALDELERLLATEQHIQQLEQADPHFFDSKARLREVAITPDFHKGAGIPIGTTMFTEGFVIPQAVGKDINCGMRFYTTDLKEEEIRTHLPRLEQKIRHIFFEGGRDIPMTSVQREAILKRGLIGILESHAPLKNEGIWRYYDAGQQERDLSYVNKMGSFISNEMIGFDSFVGNSSLSRDAQIGSIGGGNHFVEVQKVKKVHHYAIANEWNLHEGQIVFMIHTGSVRIGHHSAMYIKEMMKKIYPSSLSHPDNDIYILPKTERYQQEWQAFWSLLHNAANFAFANRLFLGLMLYKSLAEEIREFDYQLLYDAPHNYVWEETIDGVEGFLHRKGSCTAKSAEQMSATPFYATGEPVMIPGSMGAHSFLLAGKGNRSSLYSASHGAGRQHSRGSSLRIDDALFRDFMKRFTIINPINPRRPDLRNRRDILQKWEEELKKEAPYAYKDITSVIRSHVDYGMADIVAEMEPIFTIKG